MGPIKKADAVLPVGHRAVAVEVGHGDLGREGVFSGLFFVDLDAQAGRRGRVRDAFFELSAGQDYMVRVGSKSRKFCRIRVSP